MPVEPRFPDRFNQPAHDNERDVADHATTDQPKVTPLSDKYWFLVGQTVRNIETSEIGKVIGLDPQPRKDPFRPPLPVGEYLIIQQLDPNGIPHDRKIVHWEVSKVEIPPKQIAQ